MKSNNIQWTSVFSELNWTHMTSNEFKWVVAKFHISSWSCVVACVSLFVLLCSCMFTFRICVRLVPVCSFSIYLFDIDFAILGDTQMKQNRKRQSGRKSHDFGHLWDCPRQPIRYLFTCVHLSLSFYVFFHMLLFLGSERNTSIYLFDMCPPVWVWQC